MNTLDALRAAVLGLFLLGAGFAGGALYTGKMCTNTCVTMTGSTLNMTIHANANQTDAQDACRRINETPGATCTATS